MQYRTMLCACILLVEGQRNGTPPPGNGNGGGPGIAMSDRNNRDSDPARSQASGSGSGSETSEAANGGLFPHLKTSSYATGL